ncbi:MAG: ABC transporter permease [Thermoflexales bacterium]|nr:ABC transporter permease [Thermoflexales bacterium]
MTRLRTPLALGIIALFVLLALLAPVIAPYDPFQGGQDALKPPLSPGHLLGTNHIGQDILSQLLHGARVSLAVGVSAALSAALIGALVGSLAGFFGGWVDGVLMRVSEFFQVLPRFVLALVIVAFFGSGTLKLIVVLALLSWPQTARLARAQILSLREATFVDAGRLSGMKPLQLITREILPNALAPVVIAGSLDIASAILLEASLSFFGLGDPNTVSWGFMLNFAQAYLRQAWWMALFPGMAISIVVLTFNILGDALNDALNPRLRETV